MTIPPALDRKVVVIGASTGGIDALKSLLSCLPADFPGALFVVVHTAPDSPGILPQMLARAGKLPTQHARDGDAIERGRVYVAPPDHHLVLERGRMRLTHGPKENRFRPAVDPLFRSAAQSYGAATIGVILSGGLDDGTTGLWTIKDRGGLAIVQDPTEALVPSMPLNALKHVTVDYSLPVTEIAQVLIREAGMPVTLQEGLPMSAAAQIETSIALETDPLTAGVSRLGSLSPYTCPECSGVLFQMEEGGILRFRCHTGHAYSAESLMAAIADSIEDTLWSAVRVLEQHMILLRHLARHALQQQDTLLSKQLETRAQTAQDQVQIMRQMALNRRDRGQPQDL